LINEGKIGSVDDAANTYLQRHQIPREFDQDVTIRHLLTHSAGYELKGSGLGSYEEINTPVSEEYINDGVPMRAFSAGKVTAYSNFSTMLLGLIVEDVSGLSIREYFKRNIWQPLGMTSADFATEMHIPEGLVRPIIKTKEGDLTKKPYLPFNPLYWPVGAITLTAEDMSKYVRAHMLEGRNVGSDKINEDVFRLAHMLLFTNHPGVSGFGMKVVVGSWNGYINYSHGGSWPGFDSYFLAFPELKKAFFVSMATMRGAGKPMSVNELRLRMLEAIAGPEEINFKEQSADYAAYAGEYLNFQRSYDGPEKFLTVLSPGGYLVKVEQNPNGDGILIDGVGPYLHAGDDLVMDREFKFNPSNPFASSRYAFIRDDEGEVIGLSAEHGLWAYEKLNSGSESPAFYNSLAMYGGLGIFLALLLPFWRRREPNDRNINYLQALLPLMVIALVSTIMFSHGEGGLEYYIISGQKTRFFLVSVIAYVFLAITLLAAFNNIKLWRGRVVGENSYHIVYLLHKLFVLIAAILLVIAFMAANFIF